MRALIDTCIIIDALQSRLPFKDNAQEIFLLAANRQFEGFITAKASTDIYYLTHKYLHSDKETRKVLSGLYMLFELLDTAGIDCRKAISSEMADFEDAVMVETALRCGMDCIITRNVIDYEKPQIEIYQPDEFLELFH
ncbi:MAG: PIN domain-containing protein [Lachnospiraceae bacterium]|nr:PIN domain-containing protein [Lachnospiraceae bacterium]